MGRWESRSDAHIPTCDGEKLCLRDILNFHFLRLLGCSDRICATKGVLTKFLYTKVTHVKRALSENGV